MNLLAAFMGTLCDRISGVSYPDGIRMGSTSTGSPRRRRVPATVEPAMLARDRTGTAKACLALRFADQ